MRFNALNTSGPLHSISYAMLFFSHPHVENPTIQMQDLWLSHFLLLWTPCLKFTLLRPKTLLNPTIFQNQTDNLTLLTVLPPQLLSVHSFHYIHCMSMWYGSESCMYEWFELIAHCVYFLCVCVCVLMSE